MRQQSLGRAALLAGGLVALAGCGRTANPAPATPSVLVGARLPVQGAVPDLVEVYGAAAPAAGALQTLNLDQPAQVEAILTAPGAVVKAGQRLIAYSLDPAAISAFRQATAALKLALAQQAHANQLLAQQLATRDQAAQAEANLRSAQANLAALTQQGAGVGAGGVAAPFDGIVVSIPVAAGDQVAAGAPLVTVARNTGLVVTAGFDPSQAIRLRVGQAATLQSLSGGQPLQGRVLRVAGALNPKTRLVDADIGVSGASPILGDAFRAAVTVGQVTGWIAPHASVLSDPKGTYVFQVAGGKARRVDVNLIRSGGDVDVIQGPLDPRLRLVADGAYQLEDGVQVRTGSAR